MRPRKDRWYTLIELARILEPSHPRLTDMKRATRRKYVYRILRALERRNSTLYAKRVGRALYVSKRALEDLLPQETLKALDQLEQNQIDLAQDHRKLKSQVNDHGARIRILEKKQKLTAEFLARYAALDRDETGT